MKQLHLQLASQAHGYQIKIGRGLLDKLGREARRRLGPKSRRVAVISNHRVFDLYGRTAMKSLQASDFGATHWLMSEGERFKSLRSLEKALAFLSQSGLERDDAVVALGGGVVGDLAGFAAAVYLRGIELIQAPTTLLAQIDSSVGGKTGVNLPSGKNLVGAFHQPAVVLIDTETLTTLSSRDLTAGWCEAIKNGAAGSRNLFRQTTEFLSEVRRNPKAFHSKELESLIASQCAFKSSIVMRDPFEQIARKDRFSRRILNFGHTVGHALEAVTNYRRFRHGEAVGYGMLVAGELSKNLGLLEASELESLREAVGLCGSLPAIGSLSEEAIIEAIGRDKKSLAGNVQWVLLERIGRARIVDGREIAPELLRASLRSVVR
jgi:3-dehydroquinate synthase